MRVVVVGSGGREHALAVALARTADVIVTPGNPGMAAAGIPTTGQPPEQIGADLVVIGPEAPLVDGLADRLRAAGTPVFGPGADGARLEGSKAWMKALLADAGVPTAAHATFAAGQEREAEAWLRDQAPPWVVKTDALAAGKGVLVTDDLDVAIADVQEKLSGVAFGAAGRRVVLEEGMTGPELSVMAVCDGVRAVPLAAAQDHKRLGEGDTGPNTGGMGAFSPVPGVDAELVATVMATAVQPTLDALRARGIDYRGVLYAGLMLTPAGPRVLEFNVRFGDPETQVVLPRWEGDVTAVLAAAAGGDLTAVAAPTFANSAAVCVVLAAGGYPQSPVTGDPISGLDAAAARPGVDVYAAGVATDAGGALVTAGGRVLGVTGLDHSITAARDRAYRAVGEITWPAVTYRRDIAATEEGSEP